MNLLHSYMRRIEAGSSLKKFTSFVSVAGAGRLSDARERVLAVDPPILIMAATRAAADEFALSLAAEKGATFGVTRSSVAELVSRLALPALAKKRSEEHTSELQSQSKLVCRLLLEQKNRTAGLQA